MEQRIGIVKTGQHGFCHAVVNQIHQRDVLVGSEAARHIHIIGNAALHALHRRQTTVMHNVGGLARPRRQSTKARHHQQQFTAALLRLALGIPQ